MGQDKTTTFMPRGEVDRTPTCAEACRAADEATILNDLVIAATGCEGVGDLISLESIQGGAFLAEERLRVVRAFLRAQWAKTEAKTQAQPAARRAR